MNETLHQARLHDLTIVARVPELTTDRLDSLVMAAGKPVLVPPAKPAQTVGETVVVAWKDKPEAARAITASLPILTHAKHVIVVSVSESKFDQDPERSSG
ncbi:MAG TPA: hypothetical protein VKB67_10815 [Rhizomicrobium sp.]|nr:hypothetical protein [Rhizomicrobium sp.]